MVAENNKTRLFGDDSGGDNITDWALDQFRNHYQSDRISKDDIWYYSYGVMHAKDWRSHYKADLRRELPRIPLAADFQAFVKAGTELFDLHINYRHCPEYKLHLTGLAPRKGQPIDALIDAPVENYRIDDKMGWLKLDSDSDDSAAGRSRTAMTCLRINSGCYLYGIPARAHDYKISGRSPLEWAVDTLRAKTVKRGSNRILIDDPNTWLEWADDPEKLISHLKKLCYLSVKTIDIIDGLPDSLSTKTSPAASQ